MWGGRGLHDSSLQPATDLIKHYRKCEWRNAALLVLNGWELLFQLKGGVGFATGPLRRNIRVAVEEPF
jgi:hypothetical protein